ncbi:MAG: hypothetical protein V1848_03485 [Candidatus Magasanikbacteria bacterium]
MGEIKIQNGLPKICIVVGDTIRDCSCGDGRVMRMASNGSTETQTIHFQCTCGATYKFLFVPLTMISGQVFDVPNQE